ncbi:2-dehydro-3-deoxyphosphooctonate aldolase, putative isoform 1 [Quillaja saponaria]|uniref:2-dehydro-3-deoxyphosphooctonate aldolase, putative isoform 1 n=1 Tax=Quillaja saponaria TaxID=32244 RepID=A0AAD7P6R0_QUISA|nr:2-dehydro-3-deoxyphosphooctonate aldolase, putative isoform 1 [Quillaja saponaria]
MNTIGASAGNVARFCRVGCRTLKTAALDSCAIGNTKLFESSSKSSELRKFLNLPDSSRSETAMLISKFIKIQTARSPGIKKDRIWEDNLQTLLHRKKNSNKISAPVIVAKILSPEFSHGYLSKDDEKEIKNQCSTDNEKAKPSQKKKKSSMK